MSEGTVDSLMIVIFATSFQRLNEVHLKSAGHGDSKQSDALTRLRLLSFVEAILSRYVFNFAY